MPLTKTPEQVFCELSAAINDYCRFTEPNPHLQKLLDLLRLEMVRLLQPENRTLTD